MFSLGKDIRAHPNVSVKMAAISHRLIFSGVTPRAYFNNVFRDHNGAVVTPQTYEFSQLVYTMQSHSCNAACIHYVHTVPPSSHPHGIPVYHCTTLTML